jgi:hypothetical protein
VGIYDDRVLRWPLSGAAAVETVLLYPQVLDPVALTIDPVSRRLYWVQSSGEFAYNDKLLAASMDGGDTVETLLQWPQLEQPTGLTFVQSSESIPAASTWGLVALSLLILVFGTVAIDGGRRA